MYFLNGELLLNYQIEKLDTTAKVDKNGALLWSGRGFQWELKHKGDQLIVQVENGQWVARDLQGKEVDPC